MDFFNQLLTTDFSQTSQLPQNNGNGNGNMSGKPPPQAPNVQGQRSQMQPAGAQLNMTFLTSMPSQAQLHPQRQVQQQRPQSQTARMSTFWNQQAGPDFSHATNIAAQARARGVQNQLNTQQRSHVSTPDNPNAMTANQRLAEIARQKQLKNQVKKGQQNRGQQVMSPYATPPQRLPSGLCQPTPQQTPSTQRVAGSAQQMPIDLTFDDSNMAPANYQPGRPGTTQPAQQRTPTDPHGQAINYQHAPAEQAQVPKYQRIPTGQVTYQQGVTIGQAQKSYSQRGSPGQGLSQQRVTPGQTQGLNQQHITPGQAQTLNQRVSPAQGRNQQLATPGKTPVYNFVAPSRSQQSPPGCFSSPQVRTPEPNLQQQTPPSSVLGQKRVFDNIAGTKAQVYKRQATTGANGSPHAHAVQPTANIQAQYARQRQEAQMFKQRQDAHTLKQQENAQMLKQQQEAAAHNAAQEKARRDHAQKLAREQAVQARFNEKALAAEAKRVADKQAKAEKKAKAAEAKKAAAEEARYAEEKRKYDGYTVEKETKLVRLEVLRHDRFAIYHHYNEYLELFPLDKDAGERRDPYLNYLLANRKMPYDADSDLALAITYAQANWERYMQYPRDITQAANAQREKVANIAAGGIQKR
ncbi:hypothetical protein CC86DRAFT_427497 [Ophiobolus disseminans]|uniref:Uncharacterized protein n=1 Tax=Ophiobolus disseminans TaxID=1469910 RepID=A0A6A6ZKH1_9PLEO|nr:hypothetical protein CC86DRAFT_427497 [Ophiobolus disseminans]